MGNSNRIPKGFILKDVTAYATPIRRLEIADGNGGVEGHLSNVTVNTPPEGVEIVGNGNLQHPLEVKMNNLYKSAPKMQAMLVRLQSLMVSAGIELEIADELDALIIETIPSAESHKDSQDSCPKCGGKGQEPHSCPYASDVCGDNETTCACCEECEHQCSQDI